MRKGLVVAVLIFLVFAGTGPTRAQEITITPASPDVGNCYPFGMGSDVNGEWGALHGIYLPEHTAVHADAG